MDLVASRYNIKIPLRDGGCLLYNSSRGNFMRLDPHEVQRLEEVESGTIATLDDDVVINDLFDNAFVVPKDVDELQLLRDQYEAHRFDPHTMTLTIAPTMACNFKCDYCFQGQDKPHETMSMAVQDAIIDFVDKAAQQGLRRLGVCWYGGEPLLRLNVIEALSDRLMALCDQHHVTYTAQVVTNGYKLDLPTAKSLHSRKVEMIQVTLDGTPEYHNTRRYLLGGQASFDRILTNLRDIVDETPIAYSIRVNIDSRNQGDIRKLIDVMVENGLGHRPNLGMYFAPVEALTEGCHNVSEVTMTKGMYGTLEADLCKYGWSAGLVPLPYPPKFHGVCGAIKPQGLVVLPTGDIHKCWDTVSMPEKKAGTIFKPAELIASEVSLMWMKWSPFDNNSCRNCKILPNCTGACAYKFVYAESTRGEAAVLPCPSWKYNIKERLLWRAVALGNVTPEEFDPAAVATVPKELCTDDAVTGGKDLPTEMAVHYEHQKRYLPVIRS